MNKLTSHLRHLKLRQFVSIFIIGIALFFSTACNSGNLQGARPEVPPVQMGGNNNPHSMGGDGYTEYKASTDPKVNRPASNLRSSLGDVHQAIASNSAEIKSNASDLLYPGSSMSTSDRPDIGPRGKALEPEPFPAERQTVIDRSNPDEKIMERINRQFKDASEFLQETADYAVEQAGEERDINAAK